MSPAKIKTGLENDEDVIAETPDRKSSRYGAEAAEAHHKMRFKTSDNSEKHKRAVAEALEHLLPVY